MVNATRALGSGSTACMTNMGIGVVLPSPGWDAAPAVSALAALAASNSVGTCIAISDVSATVTPTGTPSIMLRHSGHSDL